MRSISLLLFPLMVGLLPVGAQEESGSPTGSARVDRLIRAKWEEAGVSPAEPATDAEFMRRASLDIVGVIPTLAEAERFLADSSPDKRSSYVESLLRSPEYATHWADIWAEMLLGLKNEPRQLLLFFKARAELREMFEKNLPFDQFARVVITARGAVYPIPGTAQEAGAGTPPEAGLASYIFKIFQESQQDLPKALAGKLSRTFLGIQIQCAQCHDHPFDRWTQEEFYGMASFFTELLPRRQPIPDKNPPAPGQMKMPRFYFEIDDRNSRSTPFRRGPLASRMGMGLGMGMDLSIPEGKGGPVRAAFLDTKEGVEPGTPRRVQFAKYMTEKSNLQFARAAVNRTWAHFFGAGFVNPPDDFSATNKPTHPELLDALARDFIEHGYDLHWLIRAITGSEAYGRTSRAKDRSGSAEKLFALARVRALSPEQILGSVFVATGRGQASPAAPALSDEMRRRMMFGLLAQFRYAFGDDEGNELSDFTGSIPSALLMMNSPIVARGTGTQPGGTLERVLAAHAGVEDRIRSLFLLVLSRPPTDSERERWSAALKGTPGNAGYEDLVWTLLNTSEFLFNH
jgi:hypothetical protein